ncbi:response regulator transcription factor [Spirosoma sp.]|uniref:response regulator transcription factor n=1 Tax=Spirosoma sp. TaxID=1899569 RepID=UPI002606F66F|nr:response regulator transcription factor [Spirosoma sp.]MCX6217306.1 response regulator transcription factor [Spirosoma sp.]
MNYNFSSLAAASSTILLVDEDRFIAGILRQTLQAEFTIKYVSNGMEAMHWLEQGNSPALIITELKMAQLDGRKLIRLIRDSTLLSHLPIIVLSDSDDSNTRIECLESGADGYLVKPFNPLEVKAKVRAILRRSTIEKTSMKHFPERLTTTQWVLPSAS